MIKKGKGRSQTIPWRSQVDKRTGEHTPRVAPEMFWEKEIKGMKAVRSCPRCFAVYYDKHWHSWPKAVRAADFLRDKTVEHMLCTECSGIVTGHGVTGWEGEVLLRGVSPDIKGDVIRTARNVGTRASRMDPEDQIIKIEDKGSLVRIITTENQLAVRIGKKVDESFKGGKLTIKYSHEDEPVRVVWIAP